jgi:RND family efflux transporter MFP subunit
MSFEHSGLAVRRTGSGTGSTTMLLRITLAAAIFSALLAGVARSKQVTLTPQQVTDYKAVYGSVEAKDVVPARARIGGTVLSLQVSEGDFVAAGQVLATIVDDKIDFQLRALDARLQALQSTYDNMQSELKRAEELMARGATTAQRRDALRTRVDVARNNISAAVQDRKVLEQQRADGAVVAPETGRVVTVPLTKGAVVLPGETLATIGVGGYFLRLAIPERFRKTLRQGTAIRIDTDKEVVEGTLVKIYPQIENGRVIADVSVPNLENALLGSRILVRIPLGTRPALLLPLAAVETRFGLDMVRVVTMEDKVLQRVVLLGQRRKINGKYVVEVLGGLNAGDKVLLP